MISSSRRQQLHMLNLRGGSNIFIWVVTIEANEGNQGKQVRCPSTRSLVESDWNRTRVAAAARESAIAEEAVSLCAAATSTD